VWGRRLARHPYWRDADVIYSVSFKGHAAAAIAGGPPVVWHLHEFPPPALGAPWRALARMLPNALIANSAAVGHAWEPAGPLTVVPNGVDLDRFRPRARTGWIHDQLGIPRDKRLIGMPAVFARWKGQLAVIEAARALFASLPDAHLVLVGGSIYDTVAEREYGEELRVHTGEMSIAQLKGEAPQTLPGMPRVHMLPFQPKIELAYPEFDVVVHYSLRPEPFGRVILEGMACGVPVIAAAEGGPLEIVGGAGPGRFACGWLVEPRRPEALAATLGEVLRLPAEARAAAGQAGRTRAEDHFSARVFARGVAGVLRTVGGTGA
jgi:glycosyltransferase involved in cell wall biosynthesis